jgi:predicted RNase H-like HicB family nuclease
MGGLGRLLNSPVQLKPEERLMQTIKYVHWQEDDAWLGYLEEYPDYWTQGDTLADLVEHLKDLYLDLSGGHIPGARKVGELVMP